MIKISNGRSEIDRITFSTSEYSMTAIRKPDGKIETERKEKKDIVDEMTYKKALISLFFSIGIFIIKAYLIVPFIDNNSNRVYFYLIPVLIYTLYSIIPTILTCIKKRETLKNHGAEHKVFTAYNKLKRVPTIEEAKRYSRFNRHCGCCYIGAVITTQLIGFLVFKNYGIIVSELILYFIPLFFGNLFPLNMLGMFYQIFTTAKPDDENLELAISAIQAIENWENNKNKIDEVMFKLLTNIKNIYE